MTGPRSLPVFGVKISMIIWYVIQTEIALDSMTMQLVRCNILLLTVAAYIVACFSVIMSPQFQCQPIKQLTVHFRNGNYEVEKAADYLRTINAWAQVRRGLKFSDARGHVLREADTPLKFPISGSNDVVLVLRQYMRQALLSSIQHSSVNLYTCFGT